MTLFLWLVLPLALYFGFTGWLTFGRGAFRFVYNRHIAKLLKYDGCTVGARCYVKKPELIAEFPNGLEPLHLPINSPARRWWRHENDGHGHQWRVRPFMGPVYLVWDKLVGYKRNPLEIEAEREEEP